MNENIDGMWIDEQTNTDTWAIIDKLQLGVVHTTGLVEWGYFESKEATDERDGMERH